MDENSKNWPQGLVVRNNTFSFVRMINGAYLRQSLRTQNEKDAIKLVENINYDISRGVDVAEIFKKKKEQKKKEKNTFFELAELFLKEKENDGLRVNSLKRYRSSLNNFLDFLELDKGISGSIVQINTEIALKYKLYMQNDKVTSSNGHKNSLARKGVKPKTLKSELALLKSAFALGIKLKWISENPFEDVKPGKLGKKDFRFLSEEEIDRFLGSAKRYDDEIRAEGFETWGDFFHDAFLFFLKTGLRENELLVLEYTDINFKEATITIVEKKFTDTRVLNLKTEIADKFKLWTKEGRFPFKSVDSMRKFPPFQLKKENSLMLLQESDLDYKNNKLTFSEEKTWIPKASEGVIPATPKLLELLKKIKKERGRKSNFIFPGKDGGMLRLQLRNKLIKVANHAGIGNFTKLHSLRHTFATQLRRKGVPIETLKELLRHADIRETMIYAHYEINEGRKAIDKLDDLF